MHILVSSLNNKNEQLVKGSFNDVWVKEVFNDFDYKIKKLSFELRFKKNGEFIELDGHIDASVSLNCVRCLKAFTQNIDNDFKVYLYSENGSLVTDGGEIELKAHELEFVQIEAGQIFPAEIIREQLLLMLPDYPLCNAECHCKGCTSVDVQGVDNNKENPFIGLSDLKL